MGRHLAPAGDRTPTRFHSALSTQHSALPKAFTLIEVLVVIAIIMILIGILLPSLEHVRHQAYIADCASNLRQVGAAITLYANENHGNFPRTRYTPGAPL